MIILFFIYILTIFVVNLVLKHKHNKFFPIKKATLSKKGVYFFSEKGELKNKLSNLLATEFMVRETGLEPVRAAPHAPQTCASADSATLAYSLHSLECLYTISLSLAVVKSFLKSFLCFFGTLTCEEVCDERGGTFRFIT